MPTHCTFPHIIVKIRDQAGRYFETHIKPIFGGLGVKGKSEFLFWY